MNRRGFIKGLLAAPVVITTPGLLMPVKPVWGGATTIRYDGFVFDKFTELILPRRNAADILIFSGAASVEVTEDYTARRVSVNRWMVEKT